MKVIASISLMSALCLLCLISHAGGIVDVNIRKIGTNVVISYGGDDYTNEMSRTWFRAIGANAKDSDVLNIVATLGDLTFIEVAEAIQDVAPFWRGPVFVNITAVDKNDSIVTMTTYSQRGKDVNVRRSSTHPKGRAKGGQGVGP